MDRVGIIRMLFLITVVAGGSGHGLLAASATDRERSRDIAEIRAVLDAQAAAWNRGDIDGFMNGYAQSDATEFVSGDKLTRGWQTVRDRYRKKYSSRQKMGTLTFSELKITPLGRDAALVIGRWKLLRKTDQPQGRFTLIFNRTPFGWRIVHDHTS
ncbi:MAG TPA: nuclear transport factor 2 family protein [Chthoniobacterales bacterium]|jgi:ketosteroid isomerase-like protein